MADVTVGGQIVDGQFYIGVSPVISTDIPPVDLTVTATGNSATDADNIADAITELAATVDDPKTLKLEGVFEYTHPVFGPFDDITVIAYDAVFEQVGTFVSDPPNAAVLRGTRCRLLGGHFRRPSAAAHSISTGLMDVAHARSVRISGYTNQAPFVYGSDGTYHIIADTGVAFAPLGSGTAGNNIEIYAPDLGIINPTFSDARAQWRNRVSIVSRNGEAKYGAANYDIVRILEGAEIAAETSQQLNVEIGKLPAGVAVSSGCAVVANLDGEFESSADVFAEVTANLGIISPGATQFVNAADITNPGGQFSAADVNGNINGLSPLTVFGQLNSNTETFDELITNPFVIFAVRW